MAKTEAERKAVQAAWWKRNRAKAAAYRKQWRVKNPEKAKELDTLRRKKYADRIRTRNREYCRRNKDKIVEWKKRYQTKHREKYLESIKRSHAKHPEIAINAKAKRRHRLGAYRLSKGLTQLLLAAQNGCCNKCQNPFGDSTPHHDHIMPLSKGGLNIDSNIQLLCRKCNQEKGSKIPETIQSPLDTVRVGIQPIV